jgi:hypothetical protein
MHPKPSSVTSKLPSVLVFIGEVLILLASFEAIAAFDVFSSVDELQDEASIAPPKSKPVPAIEDFAIKSLRLMLSFFSITLF